VATVDVVAVRGREEVELAPPHPAISTAIATPNAATPRTVGAGRGELPFLVLDIGLR
jgi:hypothetical protein